MIINTGVEKVISGKGGDVLTKPVGCGGGSKKGGDVLTEPVDCDRGSKKNGRLINSSPARESGCEISYNQVGGKN